MNLTETSGFFPQYYLNIKNVCDPDEIEKIINCQNDLDRVSYIDNLKTITENDLQINRTYDGKNLATSLAYKEKATEAFRNKNWLEAMVLYTRSYISMPGDMAQDIAIILANRSATLSHMQKHEDTLLDISRAMKFGYPKDIMYKLYERRAKTYLALKDYPNALEAFQKTVSTLDDSTLSLDKKKKIERESMIMIKMLDRDPNTAKMAAKLAKKGKTTEILSKTIADEKQFISDAIRIDSSKEEGRYARAACDIKVGEEILVEKPNVAALLKQYSKTHCQNCFIRVAIAVACPNCADVAFCSEKCYEQAASTYHRYECGLLPTIWRSGASINCHLALRIIASKSLKYFQNIEKDIEKDYSFDQLKKFPYDDYRRVCHLVRHEEGRNASNFFQHSLMARFLTKCLSHGGYFDTTEPSQQDILFIMSLMLRNLQFIQFNAHEVSELHCSRTPGGNEKTIFIGGAVYGTLALFNHSCDPSIVRFFRGTTIHVNTVKSIEAGLQISENYGPMYTQETYEERQSKLKELYWFVCSCDACLDNWPRFEDMRADSIRFRCDAEQKCYSIIEVSPDCNDLLVKCSKCKQNTNILKGLKVMQDTEMINRTGKRLYDAGDYSKALNKFIDLLKIMNEVLAPPFADYCQCQQSIKDCFLHFGNVYHLD